MAQLTEDIQPSFDVTLKSKAVSENCNVKLFCVVSGYPAPELKWYKDDMEMDRYCGLPKYEIRRNGKTHTLHIYNCTLDDAAIYQVSASNSKGIVSCSGVLEVGTMSEFKIHQRFFAKLKVKAENKKRELEESKKRGSPDRSQRKRPVPPPPEEQDVQEPEPEAVEANGLSAEEGLTDFVTDTDNDVENMEIVPSKAPPKETTAKKKIKMSNGVDAAVGSNGNSRSHVMGNGGENSYDGGFGLAQFLAETLQSQEKPNSLAVEKPTGLDASIADTSNEKEKMMEGEEQEKGRQIAEEKERARQIAEEKERGRQIAEEKERGRQIAEEKERGRQIAEEKERGRQIAEEKERGRQRAEEKERERQIAEEKERERQMAEENERQKVIVQEVTLPHKTAHTIHVPELHKESKDHKDHEHHKIQASISSVLHSVKDFFFGKGKKDGHDHKKHGEKEVSHSAATSQQQPTPPSSHRLVVEPSPPPSRQLVVAPSPPPSRQLAVAPSPPSHQLAVEPSPPPSRQLVVESLPPPSGQLAVKPLPPPRRQLAVKPPAPPSLQPVEEPSPPPSHHLVVEPSPPPSLQPLVEPSPPPSHHLMVEPSPPPSQQPVEKPSSLPSHHLVVEPSPPPSQQPVEEPSSPPSHHLVVDPSPPPSCYLEVEPPQPPSQQHGEQEAEISKAQVDEIVPMELGTPYEPLMKALSDEQTVTLESLKPQENDYGLNVLHTEDRTLSQKRPESTDSTERKDEENTEAMEVSEVSEKVVRSGQEETTSTLEPPTRHEAAEDSQAVSEERCVLPVSPDEHAVTTKSLSSSIQDLSDLPQKQASSRVSDKLSSVAAGSSSSNSIASTKERILDGLTTETLQEDGKQQNNSPNDLRKEEEVDVKLEIHPCIDMNRSEVAELEAISLKERIEACDSKTPTQVPVIFKFDTNTVGSADEEKEYLKRNVESLPSAQENNVDSAVTGVPENLENNDLKIPREDSLLAKKDIDVNKNESSNSASEEHGVESVIKAENVGVNSLCNLKMQEQVVESSVERTEDFESKGEFKMENEDNSQKKASESDKPERLSEGGVASVFGEPLEKACADTTGLNMGGFIENVPEKRISSSTMEDIPGIKIIVPELRVNEHVIIPKIEIMDADIKEPDLLPKISAQMPKSEMGDETKVSEEILSEHHKAAPAVTVVVTPAQERMLNHDAFPPTEKVQEVMQPHDKTEIQPPQTGHASVPIIDVSYADDDTLREDVHALVKPSVLNTAQIDEAPKVPLFVVPPISVISDDGVTGGTLPTHEETLAAVLREPKIHLESNIEHHKSHTKHQSPDAITYNISNAAIVHKPPVPVEIITTDVSDSVSITEAEKMKPIKVARTESDTSVEELQRDKPSTDRLGVKTSTPPAMSPTSLRRFLAKAYPSSDTMAVVPAITVADSQSDKTGEELSGGSTPTSSLSCESSPRLKRRDSLSLIRSATPEELASGARRKIFIPKTKEELEGVGVPAVTQDVQAKKETPYMSPSQARRASLQALQAPAGQQTPPMERRSSFASRRKVTLEVPKVVEETPKEQPTKPEEKPAEKEKLDPFKAPQVIRKIRGEPFPDASGHLKLWCQFFNVLSDSIIKWSRDEEEILEVKRSGGDESQVALAIVQASNDDCGVYGCSIKNEYGSDSTDYLLSADVLSDILLKDDFEVGEEIEMTPLVFTKGLADSGTWGEKFFGRIMTEQAPLGEGTSHKASRVKVIYGLDPVFESGSTCIIKIQNPIAYGTKAESNLAERNLEITKHECKVQNMVREYCKIFAAETRVIGNFGFTLEILPQYLMYRPANSVPYATVEMDVQGIYMKYCTMDAKGNLTSKTTSEVEQKCCTFQHWIHQWTHSNLMVIQLEGVGALMTNIRVVTKSKGYQGLTEDGSPKVFEQFLTHHQCNYYCGLLGLRPLKPMDSLQQPTKIKGSRSPLLNRKLAPGSSSPQLGKKGTSPQIPRKVSSSPKVPRKTQETDNNKPSKTKTAETVEVV